MLIAAANPESTLVEFADLSAEVSDRVSRTYASVFTRLLSTVVCSAGAAIGLSESVDALERISNVTAVAAEHGDTAGVQVFADAELAAMRARRDGWVRDARLLWSVFLHFDSDCGTGFDRPDVAVITLASTVVESLPACNIAQDEVEDVADEIARAILEQAGALEGTE